MGLDFRSPLSCSDFQNLLFLASESSEGSPRKRVLKIKLLKISTTFEGNLVSHLSKRLRVISSGYFRGGSHDVSLPLWADAWGRRRMGSTPWGPSPAPQVCNTATRSEKLHRELASQWICRDARAAAASHDILVARWHEGQRARGWDI